MKKLLIIFLGLLVAFLAVSCNSEAKTDLVEVFVPSNSTSGNSMGVKGLSDMHLDHFVAKEQIEYGITTETDMLLNLQFAEQTMSTLPVLPGLKKYNIDKKNASVPSFTMYGFTCVPEKCEAKADGVFVRYKIMESGSQVGLIDYYYYKDGKESRISYREYNMLTIDIPGLNLPETYGLLVVELNDIPLNNINGNIVDLEAGQLNKDGSLEKNAFVDIFGLIESDTQQNKLYGKLKMMRRYYSLKMKGNTITSFIQPKGMYYEDTFWKDAQPLSLIKNGEFISDCKNIINGIYGTDAFTNLINSENEITPTDFVAKKDKFDIDTLWALYEAVYGDSNSVKNAKYADYSSFKKNSVEGKLKLNSTIPENNFFITKYNINGFNGYTDHIEVDSQDIIIDCLGTPLCQTPFSGIQWNQWKTWADLSSEESQVLRHLNQNIQTIAETIGNEDKAAELVQSIVSN